MALSIWSHNTVQCSTKRCLNRESNSSMCLIIRMTNIPRSKRNYLLIGWHQLQTRSSNIIISNIKLTASWTCIWHLSRISCSKSWQGPSRVKSRPRLRWKNFKTFLKGISKKITWHKKRKFLRSYQIKKRGFNKWCMTHSVCWTNLCRVR